MLIGGSAGARVFSDFITNTLELIKHSNIINISEDKCLSGLSQNLYRADYITDLYQPLMDTADVVMTQGGSNIIPELTAVYKLHSIAPLGKEASYGD